MYLESLVATWLIFLFQFNFWSKITPKYFVDSSCSIWSPLISNLILRGIFFLADLKITKLDFLTLRDYSLLTVFSTLSMILSDKNMLVSSAKRWNFSNLDEFGILLM